MTVMQIHTPKYFRTYNPEQFLPIFEGDELLNKRQFIAYQIGKVARDSVELAERTGKAAKLLLDVMLDPHDNTDG